MDKLKDESIITNVVVHTHTYTYTHIDRNVLKEMRNFQRLLFFTKEGIKSPTSDYFIRNL